MPTQSQSRFLDYSSALGIAEEHGTPCYVYDGATLDANAAAVLAFPNAYGLTARYAMKACPSGGISAVFSRFTDRCQLRL